MSTFAVSGLWITIPSASLHFPLSFLYWRNNLVQYLVILMVMSKNLFIFFVYIRVYRCLFRTIAIIDSVIDSVKPYFLHCSDFRCFGFFRVLCSYILPLSIPLTRSLWNLTLNISQFVCLSSFMEFILMIIQTHL